MKRQGKNKRSDKLTKQEMKKVKISHCLNHNIKIPNNNTDKKFYFTKY